MPSSKRGSNQPILISDIDLCDLPKEVLLCIRDHLSTLSDHFALLGTNRSLRSLYDLSDGPQNDFRVYLGKCGLGRPVHPPSISATGALKGVYARSPQWLMLTKALFRHARKCKKKGGLQDKFSLCGGFLPAFRAISAPVVLSPTSPLSARQSIRWTKHFLALSAMSPVERHGNFVWTDRARDEEGYAEGERPQVLKHLVGACQFISQPPISELNLLNVSGVDQNSMTASQKIVNPDGLTVWDVVHFLSSRMLYWKKGRKVRDMSIVEADIAGWSPLDIDTFSTSVLFANFETGSDWEDGTSRIGGEGH